MTVPTLVLKRKGSIMQICTAYCWRHPLPHMSSESIVKHFSGALSEDLEYIRGLDITYQILWTVGEYQACHLGRY